MDYKVPILMYHMVCETNDLDEKEFCCTPKNFRYQMQYLKFAGYQPISLKHLIACMEGKNNLPSKSIIITLDDGLEDNYINAFPILKSYGYTATIFLVSELVGQTNEWAKKNGYPGRELLSWEQIREMKAAGICFGAHTATHPSLVNLDEEMIISEIRNSKTKIEEYLGETVDFFAYPYGHHNESVKKAVMASGFKAACSTRSGYNRKDVDPYALRRIDIYGTDSLFQFSLKIKFGTNQMRLRDVAKYYFSRLQNRM